MNSLTHWDPFKEMHQLQNRLANFFGRTTMRHGDGDEESITATEWAPLVDIIEDDKEYLVKAELPEVRKEDVHISVENGTLTIRGERKFEKEQKDKRYHRLERGYGGFVRSFVLPDIADAAKVSAEFKDGVLRVHLPKTEMARSRHVEVKVA